MKKITFNFLVCLWFAVGWSQTNLVTTHVPDNDSDGICIDARNSHYIRLGFDVNTFSYADLNTITAANVGWGGSQSSFDTGGLGGTSTALANIAFFTPTTATTGDIVTIRGADFLGASAVHFGGVPAASFTVINDTTINATVAAGATGDVSVTTPMGIASLTGFTFCPSVTSYQDLDGDGFGNPTVSFTGCQPTGYVLNNTDCDDGNTSLSVLYPFYADNDNDGYGAGSAVMFCALNAAAAPLGYSINNSDCNDNNSAIHPGANEICNGIDDDCDGLTDGYDPGLDWSSAINFYIDADHDGYGAAGSPPALSCTPPLGYVSNNADCNDNNAAVRPGAVEICDGIDNDCDGLVDGADPGVDVTTGSVFYLDNDGDGYGGQIRLMACSAPVGYVANNADCDDNNPAVHPGATEICDGIDNDCDGLTDSNDPDVDVTTGSVFYLDSDGDGYGGQTAIMSCAMPPGYVLNNSDCDDTNALVHPSRTEIGYNLIDDDCDGLIDEGFAPKATVLQTAMCNTVLGSIDSSLMANLVAGAQGYRWRITTLTGPNTGQVQSLDTQLRTMKITQLANYAFNTQYRVELSVRFAGFWQPFATSNCTVATPSPTTMLAGCGQSLTMMSNPVYANLVPFASGYRFKISDPLNPTNVQTIDRPLRDFRISQVTDFTVRYGKTYNIAVAVKNTDGSWLPYGAICDLETPIFPSTSLLDDYCDEFNVPSNSAQMYAASYPGAIAYVFQISGGGLSSPLEVTKNLRAFSLSDFAGQFQPGATYNVRVRLVFNASDPIGAYGKACTIVTPGLSRHMAPIGKFDAVAYPNPFAEKFGISTTASTNQDITVKIYDMTGRLLEAKTIKSDDSFSAGENYPAGVYNVILTQGESNKVIRVVKR